jgi:hypothetical protein
MYTLHRLLVLLYRTNSYDTVILHKMMGVVTVIKESELVYVV